jgi:hypothetical protein
MKKRGRLSSDEVRTWLLGKRAALGLRESTGAQFEMTGPIAQTRLYGQKIRERGMQATGLIYSFAQTGTDIFANKMVHQIVADARAKKFDVLVIAYASRFARDMHDAMVLLRTLLDLGVPVYFCKEDTLAGLEARWMRKVGRELLTAHEFSDDLSWAREETVRDMWEAHHVALGGAAFGYRYEGRRPTRLVKDERIVAGKPAWEWVRWIFDRYLTKTVSMTEIADELNTLGVLTKYGRRFTCSTIQDLLGNPIATGRVRFHPNRVDEDSKQYEELRVISNTTFARASALRRKRAESRLHPKRVKNDYVLKDLAVCGGCGANMWGRPSNARRSGKRGLVLFHKDRTDGVTCEYVRVSHNEWHLAAQVGAWLAELTLPPQAIARVREILREQMTDRTSDSLRARLLAKRARGLETYLEGDLDKAAWAEIRSRLDGQIAALPAPTVEPLAGEVELIASLGDLWAEASSSEKRDFAERLFLRLVLAPDPVAFERDRQRCRYIRGNRISALVVRPELEAIVAACRASRRELSLIADGNQSLHFAA